MCSGVDDNIISVRQGKKIKKEEVNIGNFDWTPSGGKSVFISKFTFKDSIFVIFIYLFFSFFSTSTAAKERSPKPLKTPTAGYICRRDKRKRETRNWFPRFGLKILNCQRFFFASLYTVILLVLFFVFVFVVFRVTLDSNLSKIFKNFKTFSAGSNSNIRQKNKNFKKSRKTKTGRKTTVWILQATNKRNCTWPGYG